MADLLANHVFVLFLIIAAGKLLEQIRIKSFSLGIVSIFLIAAVFGHYGYVLPRDFQVFGLAVFVYCVGIEAGPQFFSVLARKSRRWVVVPVLHFLVAMVATVSLAWLLRDRFPAETFVGLHSGALISTPAMASVVAKAPQAGALSAAFGLLYPVAFLGNTYLIPYLPKLFRQDVAKLVEEARVQLLQQTPARIFRFFRVSNPNLVGQNFGALSRLNLPEVVFSRYIEGGASTLARDDLRLSEGGYVAAVGRAEEMKALELLIGPEGTPTIDHSDPLVTNRVLVSRRDIAGKTLGELDLNERYDVRVTRIIRGGVELSPEPERQIVLGDKLVAVGTQESFRQLTAFVGDDVEEIFKTQFAPVSIGIVLGMLAGTLPLPGLGTTLGITGGILLVSMYLGHRVKFLNVLWQIPQQTNGFLKQLSLYIFFAAAGTYSGKDLVELFTTSGAASLLGAGLVIAFVPVLLTYAVSTLLLRKNPLDVVGLLAGDLNTTSILINANDVLRTEIPNLSFAFAYPFGLILALASTELAYVLLGLGR